MLNLAALYAEHVARLNGLVCDVMERLGVEQLVVHAGWLVPKSRYDDQYWPFYPEPHFAHWAPWPVAGSMLLVQLGSEPKLCSPGSAGFWEQPYVPDRDMVEAAISVEDFRHADAVRSLIGSHAFFVGSDEVTGRGLGILEDRINNKELIKALEDIRVTKDLYEITCIEQASRRAVRGHRAVQRAFLEHGERSELRLHLAYLMAVEQDEPDLPYKNIIALGENAATLHHVGYTKMPYARSLLVDAGARIRGYCSDITRTYVQSDDKGLFSELLVRMDTLQQKICDLVCVGMSYEDLHDLSHGLLADVLLELNIVSGSKEGVLEQGITRAFFPHGLGHSLGIQTHDVGCLRSRPKSENPYLRNTCTIETGQVFTIEPGFYVIDALMNSLRNGSAIQQVNWPMVEELRSYGGIRIEDNILVTDGKTTDLPHIRNLTREAFSTLTQ